MLDGVTAQDALFLFLDGRITARQCSSVTERIAAAHQTRCVGCGGEQQSVTEGCKPCSDRHGRRERRLVHSTKARTLVPCPECQRNDVRSYTLHCSTCSERRQIMRRAA